ncbi:glycosyltransferase [Clostridium gasigenes]|uniref:glycosyltransferase n=1 Tax=Clostridium gasigenes TaxID=94869 RepID=UPI001C0AD5A6|nr:glycosyltransferase [Clostridium gasigenes]MBU3089493.1 glycosyltransferase [Clostridium gasigenes]
MEKLREIELVSIVVSNYNNEKYIEECLDSLVNQTYKNIEIIIVDDASTDNSVDVINNWIKKVSVDLDKENRIVFLKLPRNVGFSGAVTAGLYLTTGEYIAMQDGDDCSNEMRIEKQIKYLKENKDIKVVGTNYATFTDKREKPKLLPNFVEYGVEKIREIYSKGGNAISYGTLLFEGNIFDSVGGLTKKIDGAEDYDYITKLLSYGADNINEGLYYYRIHTAQRSREFYGLASKKRYKIDRENLRVMLVLDRFNVGGTETHVLTLAKELLKQGIAVTILGADGPLGPEFKKLKCKIYNMEFPLIVARDKFTIDVFKEQIRRVIEAEDINIIHGHQSPSGSLALEAGREFNIPYIFTIHGKYYHDILNDKLPRCNSIISVSHPVYQWLLEAGIQSKVVPNGVIYNDFNEGSKDNYIREKYGIPKDAMVAMYCSRLAWGKVKTCENLIRVCRDLKRRENIEMHALIVGDGPGYEELNRVGNRANNLIGEDLIHFAGNQLNLVDFYATSDCVVGTGRVAIEGLAAKKIVIATGNDGYFGLINEDNFYDSWKLYFGDHGSNIVNNAMYLYNDLRKFYLEQKTLDLGIEKIYIKSKYIFDIPVIANEIIDIYLDSFN